MSNLTVQEVKEDLMKNYKSAIDNYFQKNEKESLKFLSSIVNTVQQNPKLLECEKTSLYNAFMKCAEMNLYPSNVSWEAYVLPYFVKGVPTAQFQLWYKGIVTLLYRAGTTTIYSDIVKKNDTIKIVSGMEPKIEHEYPIGDRWEPIGVYVWAEVNGKRTFKYMSRAEVETFKKFSQSASSDKEWVKKESPWNQDKDPELNMWRKTCLKQLSKLLPMNEDIYKAIAEDNQEADIEEYAKRKLRDSDKSEGLSASALLKIEEPQEETSNQTENE